MREKSMQGRLKLRFVESGAVGENEDRKEEARRGERDRPGRHGRLHAYDFIDVAVGDYALREIWNRLALVVVRFISPGAGKRRIRSSGGYGRQNKRDPGVSHRWPRSIRAPLTNQKKFDPPITVRDRRRRQLARTGHASIRLASHLIIGRGAVGATQADFRRKRSHTGLAPPINRLLRTGNK